MSTFPLTCVATKISFNHYIIKRYICWLTVGSTECYNLLDSNNIFKGEDKNHSMNYNPHAIKKNILCTFTLIVFKEYFHICVIAPEVFHTTFSNIPGITGH